MALTLNGVAQAVPMAVAGAIFEQAAETSIVMRLAQRAPSTLTGGAIPVTVGDVEADWVAEGAEKHVADPGAAVLIMEPRKVASIIVVTDEFRDANPGGLLEILQEKGGAAIGRAFDVAALFGARTVGAGPGPFATWIGQTSQAVQLGTAGPAEGGLDGDLVGAQALVADFNGYALDKTLKARLVNTRDGLGRPLLSGVDTIGGERAVFGTAIHRGDPAVAGYGGDWRKCAYGIAMELRMKMTDQATVRQGGQLVPLWQTNQIGIMLESALGFVAHDVDSNFVRFDEE